MKKQFALNTEPHIADVGGTELSFQAEVMGDDFMDAYAGLRDAQKGVGVDVDNLEDVDPQTMRAVSRALRDFLAKLMLPESAALMTRVDVFQDGKVLKSFATWDEGEAYAAEIGGGASVRHSLRLPDRVLVELMEWVVELYGGGQRPPTSSSGSAKTSQRSGRRGMGVSPSKVSTPTTGPSGG
ncbi:hypothetical protein ACFWXA_30875 [Streptomyces atroolivaceus]|uniref:hypothetical protein n=1 Tax=Streptomyces atroolivaceus TaxID=66869 RepID=UPI00364ED175